MDYLYPLLHEGMHLNLLDCEVKGTTITPRLIIVEPDCLMDISTIAACFEEYGHHPLLYFINRLKPKANSQEILLGNYAGCALDDTINDPQASMGKSFKRSFREKALEYVACPDFDAVKFKNDAARQTDRKPRFAKTWCFCAVVNGASTSFLPASGFANTANVPFPSGTW